MNLECVLRHRSPFERLFPAYSVGQGSFGAALVSSLNIGSAIVDEFKGESTANIGLLMLLCLILQDDIMKMCDTVEQARKGTQKIDEILKKKLQVYKMVYFYVTACHVFQIQTLVVGSFGIV